MLTSGWKSVSMVDVRGKVTFTLWLCGCNLRCPFCHNWRIAEGLDCFPLDREALLGELESSSFLIDYFHVTGGEPLIQWWELSSLFAGVKLLDVPISLNTNLTLVKPLEKLLNVGLVDHIATDLKAPPELYGLPTGATERLWNLFFRGLEVVSDHGIPLELRIPVARGLNQWPYIEEGLKIINTDFRVVLNPLVGRPLTNLRDENWCSRHCWPRKEVYELKEKLEGLSESLRQQSLQKPNGIKRTQWRQCNRKIYK
ncbi:anaerobic ribonucleoside-triphosphate reductase activating protein [Pyrococcus yayanosii]|uniref:Anaerobic ribonucleotide triphosphate reductase activating enzyme n=1 Tax=Pyrococcus yayanosii (strain CH1 / JCM 16557) TaxID=529709 RepID=F8AHN4_PYRYC|nr:anaerobic ribonucleoside-triphosphate reductase activating protein [Pyrococcus yayanosii]AEH25407.1 Anaerobic ribonucleotide triphosphate reductase activating enzyme [Pyrococcus yayanosii CH1]